MTAASAPGKLVLCGEYSVLEGGISVVASFSRRLTGVARDGEIWADRSQMIASPSDPSSPKLGIGSSAALCAVRALLDSTKITNAESESSSFDRQWVLAQALAHHQAIAPHGSGIDVMASVLGGIHQTKGPIGVGKSFAIEPFLLHACTILDLVFLGHSVSTAHTLERVRALREQDIVRYDSIIARLQSASELIAAGLRAAEFEQTDQGFQAHTQALGDLGQAIGLDLVSENFREVAASLRALGSSVKHSGAGGGDVALIASPSIEVRERSLQKAKDAGWLPLVGELGVEGVRFEARIEHLDKLENTFLPFAL